MFTRSVKIGRINGIDLKVSLGWVIVFGLFVASLLTPEGYDKYLEIVEIVTLGTVTLSPTFSQSTLGMLVFSTFVVAGVYLSVLLHEFGHATAAQSQGISVDGITLWIGGGVAKISKIPATREFLITIAGPAVTAVLVPVFGVISVVLFALSLQTVAWLFAVLSIFNMLMFGFNLLPLFPLDGGRILRSVLTRFVQHEKATKYATYASLSVVTTAIVAMVATQFFRYMFASVIIGVLALAEYKSFKQALNKDCVYITDNFHICDKKLNFSERTRAIFGDETEEIIAQIEELEGTVVESSQDADYIVSIRNPKYGEVEHPDKTYIGPVTLEEQLCECGVRDRVTI